jgi:hypothetical protein
MHEHRVAPAIPQCCCCLQKERKCSVKVMCQGKYRRSGRRQLQRVEVTELGVLSWFILGFNGFDQPRGGFQDLGSHLLPQIISRYISSISLCLRLHYESCFPATLFSKG